MLYSRSLLIIYFKYSSVYVSIPNSQSIPASHPSSLVMINCLAYPVPSLPFAGDPPWFGLFCCVYVPSMVCSFFVPAFMTCSFLSMGKRKSQLVYENHVGWFFFAGNFLIRGGQVVISFPLKLNVHTLHKEVTLTQFLSH